MAEAGKKPELKKTNVIRISSENYKQFAEAKRVYAHRQKKPRVTFDVFLSELLRVADMLLRGREVYAVDGHLYADPAEARGVAMITAVSKKRQPVQPDVLILLGKDDGIAGWPK